MKNKSQTLKEIQQLLGEVTNGVIYKIPKTKLYYDDTEMVIGFRKNGVEIESREGKRYTLPYADFHNIELLAEFKEKLSNEIIYHNSERGYDIY